MKKVRRLALALGLLAALVAADALWLEPHGLLLTDRVQLGLSAGPFRVVHLSDLHVAREGRRERRLVAAVAREEPELIVISGDMISDTHHLPRLRRHLGAATAVLGQLRRIAPVVAVQGHSEYLGEVVAALEEAGVDLLSNEGRWLGRGVGRHEGGFLLLGLNQQVGWDAFRPGAPQPFGPVEIESGWAYGRRHTGEESAWSYYDPSPASLADTGGPLAWSGYEVDVALRLGDGRSEGGVAVHSRYVVGEDRFLALVRSAPGSGDATTFTLVPHGTAFTAGEVNTGVEPQPGRWYRLRLLTEVHPEAVEVRARVWPAGEAEPTVWQAWAVDRSPRRVEAGTVGLWARGGTVAYRDLRVRAPAGEGVLAADFAGPEPPLGWRDGPRATRLALALARSPQAPAPTPRIALTHVPDAAPEAAYRGLEAVLAGHTHGGQVRLPGGRALLTQSSLGPHYDRGLFHLAAPNRRGWTRLYINSGVGTSLAPVRLFCPPRFAVVEVGR